VCQSAGLPRGRFASGTRFPSSNGRGAENRDSDSGSNDPPLRPNTYMAKSETELEYRMAYDPNAAESLRIEAERRKLENEIYWAFWRLQNL